MKKIFLILLGLLSLFYVVSSVRAQTPTQPQETNSASGSATTGNILFPIPELGNCSNAADCKLYCDDPTHIDACVTYAKSKGFYHASALDSQKDAIVADAKIMLGCDSLDTCKAFCADASNASKCSAFAQKHNLTSGEDSLNNTTLEKAKSELGCDSADSCRAFCQQVANQEKCAVFAQENGLRGGRTTLGPGGCTSETTCRIFCSDPNNFTACQRFAQDKSGSGSGHHAFTGPGGCTTETACQAFCQHNPTLCHTTFPGSVPRPTFFYPTGQSPNVSSEPTLSPQQYCNLYPSHCTGLTPTGSIQARYPTPDYATYCQSKGCSFSGTSCLCPTPTKSPDGTASATPTGAVHGMSTHRSLFQWIIDSLFNFR